MASQQESTSAGQPPKPHAAARAPAPAPAPWSWVALLTPQAGSSKTSSSIPTDDGRRSLAVPQGASDKREGAWHQVGHAQHQSSSQAGTQQPASSDRSAKAAAAQHHAQLLAQARRSKTDPVTGKVKCLACGVAFASYAQLAQHLGVKHGGLNSEDAKYLIYKAAQDAGPSLDSDMTMHSISSAAGSSSRQSPGTKAIPARQLAPKPSGISKAAINRGRAAVPTLADILKSAPQLQAQSPKVWPTRAPQQPRTGTAGTDSASVVQSSRQMLSQASAAGLSQGVSKVGRPATKSKALTITFGTMLPRNRVTTTSKAAAQASTSGMRQVAARRKHMQGGKVSHLSGVAALAQGRRKLRAEGAVPKKRLSHMKRLIVQRRADKGMEVAQERLAQAQASVDALEQYLSQLMQEMQAADQQVQAITTAGAPDASTQAGADDVNSCPGMQAGAAGAPAGAPAEGSASAASAPTPMAPVAHFHQQLPPAMQLAVLQLTVPKVQEQLDKARSRLSATIEAASHAQAQRAKAYRLPSVSSVDSKQATGGDGAPLESPGSVSAAEDEDESDGGATDAEASDVVVSLQSTAAPQATDSLVATPRGTVPNLPGPPAATAPAAAAGGAAGLQPTPAAQQGTIAAAAGQAAAASSAVIMMAKLAGGVGTGVGSEDDDDDDESEDGVTHTGLPAGWTDALSKWASTSQASKLSRAPAPGPSWLNTPGLWAPASRPAPTSAKPAVAAASTTLALPTQDNLAQITAAAAASVASGHQRTSSPHSLLAGPQDQVVSARNHKGDHQAQQASVTVSGSADGSARSVASGTTPNADVTNAPPDPCTASSSAPAVAGASDRMDAVATQPGDEFRFQHQQQEEPELRFLAPEEPELAGLSGMHPAPSMQRMGTGTLDVFGHPQQGFLLNSPGSSSSVDTTQPLPVLPAWSQAGAARSAVQGPTVPLSMNLALDPNSTGPAQPFTSLSASVLNVPPGSYQRTVASTGAWGSNSAPQQRPVAGPHTDPALWTSSSARPASSGQTARPALWQTVVLSSQGTGVAGSATFNASPNTAPAVTRGLSGASDPLSQAGHHDGSLASYNGTHASMARSHGQQLSHPPAIVQQHRAAGQEGGNIDTQWESAVAGADVMAKWMQNAGMQTQQARLLALMQQQQQQQPSLASRQQQEQNLQPSINDRMLQQSAGSVPQQQKLHVLLQHAQQQQQMQQERFNAQHLIQQQLKHPQQEQVQQQVQQQLRPQLLQQQLQLDQLSGQARARDALVLPPVGHTAAQLPVLHETQLLRELAQPSPQQVQQALAPSAPATMNHSPMGSSLHSTMSSIAPRALSMPPAKAPGMPPVSQRSVASLTTPGMKPLHAALPTWATGLLPAQVAETADSDSEDDGESTSDVTRSGGSDVLAGWVTRAGSSSTALAAAAFQRMAAARGNAGSSALPGALPQLTAQLHALQSSAANASVLPAGSQARSTAATSPAASLLVQQGLTSAPSLDRSDSALQQGLVTREGSSISQLGGPMPSTLQPSTLPPTSPSAGIRVLRAAAPSVAATASAIASGATSSALLAATGRAHSAGTAMQSMPAQPGSSNSVASSSLSGITPVSSSVAVSMDLNALLQQQNQHLTAQGPAQLQQSDLATLGNALNPRLARAGMLEQGGNRRINRAQMAVQMALAHGPQVALPPPSRQTLVSLAQPRQAAPQSTRPFAGGSDAATQAPTLQQLAQPGSGVTTHAMMGSQVLSMGYANAAPNPAAQHFLMNMAPQMASGHTSGNPAGHVMGQYVLPGTGHSLHGVPPGQPPQTMGSHGMPAWQQAAHPGSSYNNTRPVWQQQPVAAYDSGSTGTMGTGRTSASAAAYTPIHGLPASDQSMPLSGNSGTFPRSETNLHGSTMQTTGSSSNAGLPHVAPYPATVPPPPPPRSHIHLPEGPMPNQPAANNELKCELCHVQCNSASALQQHLSSKKHLARLARQALTELEGGAAQAAAGNQPGGSAGPSSSQTFVGPNAASHSLCRQVITPELNQVVTELLSRIRGFQERAMLKDPIKAAAHRWFVCGLREVRKACRSNKAKSVVVAPNIEQCAEEGGLDDHLQQIMDLCTEHGIPVVFALTRKKLGELYGHRKRVSAVAVLSYSSVDALHANMVQLAQTGLEEWRRLHANDAAATTDTAAEVSADNTVG